MLEKQPLYRRRGKRIKEIGAGCKHYGDEEAWSPFFFTGTEGTSKGICFRSTLLIGLIQKMFSLAVLNKFYCPFALHGNKRATMSVFAIRGSDRSVLSFHGSFSSVFLITSHIPGMNWKKGNSIFLRVVHTHLLKRKATIYIFTGVKTSSVICITKQNAHI
jgi:hypothetical protein